MTFRLLLLLCLAGTVASAQTGRLTLSDIFSFETASDPQISPDGRRVVYVRQYADVMTDKRYSNLWVLNRDGSGHRALTSGLAADTAPRWSPDGTQLLYLSDRGGARQIYRLWLDTGVSARVTESATPPSGAAWSPDGRWISFTALVPEEAPQLAALPKAPEGAKWASPARVIDRLVYRFDGAGYLKPGYTHLFVVPAEGGTARQISHGKFDHAGPIVRASEPVWTPDGAALVLSTNRHPDWERTPLNTEVYEFRAADGAVRPLTSRDGPDGNAVVSPDGTKIAYTGFDDRRQGYQVTRLYVMNRDGSGARVLTASLDRDVNQPRWSADSQGIYFLSDDRGNTGISYCGLDGKIRRVARDSGSGVFASGGGSFSVARDGAVAYTYSRPDRPADVAVAREGAPVEVLTALNADLFAGKTLAACEEIWYKSAKDQRDIHGWILKPPGFDPAKKYPLILEIHGGPFANYGDRFDLEKQLMAAAGYVVLYTNPRGSTSYGEQFGNLIHHAYPGDDFYDLNAGVDAMLAKGYIDPERLYVTGGSGGGVLTCWMIGRTTRFRAAVTVYPVVNWYSFILTSDIGNWTNQYWFPGLPWDHAAHYEQRSLLSVVKNVKTPTMVLTGEADYRTPMSDSEQYYQALKLLGVEAALVRLPDEPHGARVRPSHHVSKVGHIIGWFDRHRPGPAERR